MGGGGGDSPHAGYLKKKKLVACTGIVEVVRGVVKVPDPSP